MNQAGISEHAAIFPVDSIKVSPDLKKNDKMLMVDPDASPPLSQPNATPKPLFNNSIRICSTSTTSPHDIFSTPPIRLDRRGN